MGDDVLAHGGLIPPPFSPQRLLTEWVISPIPLALVLVAGVLYAIGVRRVTSGPAWPAGRTWAFFGGLVAVLLAVASPIDAYANVSFSTHMVQHVLLMFVAAPLFALGAPITLALRTCSPRVRKGLLLPVLHSRALAVLSNPILAFLLFISVQYATHLTGFYNAALENDAIHELEHAMYLAVALLFWWPVVGIDPAPRKMSHPVRIVFLVMLMPLEAFLAIAVLNSPPYPHYATLPAPWGGAAAVSDVSTAAAFMWVAGDLATLIAALLVAGAWLRHDQVRQRRIEAEIDRREAEAAMGAAPATPRSE